MSQRLEEKRARDEYEQDMKMEALRPVTDIKSLIERAEQALKTPAAYDTLCYLVPALVDALREASGLEERCRLIGKGVSAATELLEPEIAALRAENERLAEVLRIAKETNEHNESVLRRSMNELATLNTQLVKRLREIEDL